MEESLKKGFLSGFLWSFVGQSGYLLIALISNIILARLLSPFEFGQVGIVMFFIIIAKVLTESGLSGALIRKNDATQEDYSTVFIFNLVVSIFLFLIVVLTADFIAEFYEDSELKLILIITSSILIINAFQITHNAKLVQELKFKKKSIYSFVSILIASVVGIIMALKGYGVWSIVSVQILSSLLLTIMLWVFEGSIGKMLFSKSSFKKLYKFGVNTTLASLINTAFDNIYQLILGKFFSINQTGLFYQAKKLQEVPVGIIKSTTLGVVFSTLSKVQDNRQQFNSLYKKVITVFTVAVGFICMIIYFYAENIILLLYGEQWLGAVFFMQLLIISSFFYMQEMFNRIIFKVFDQTAKILILEIIKKAIQLITIIIGVATLSIEILMYGFVFTAIISYFINFYYSRKVLGYFDWQEIFLSIKVIFISAFTVAAAMFMSTSLSLQEYFTFWLLPLLFILYFLLAKLVGVANIVTEARVVLKLLKKKDVK